MARIRTIKPEFWTHARVTECSVSARLLFIGLWNFADDHGRMKDEPKTIKMQVYPGDNLSAGDIDQMLGELSEHKLIIRYVIDGQRYIQIDGWHHQVINRANKSRIPPAPLTDDSVSTHGAITAQTLPEKEKEKEGKRNIEAPQASPTKKASQYPKDFKPLERHIAAAREKSLDLAKQLERFAAHYQANGKTFKDWHRAFDSWLLKAEDFNRGREIAAPANGSTYAAPPADAEARLWRLHIEGWKRTGGKVWPASAGDPPGSPLCRAPRDLVAEILGAA